MSKPLVVLLGISGSGKTTLANKVSKKYGYTVLKSYTTRPPRENDEADLSSHTFCSMEEAAFMSEQKQIVCSSWFADNFYFVTRDQLDSSDIYVTDVKGLQDLYRKYYKGKEIVAIYLDVDSSIAAARMSKRGDSDEDILKRLQHDSEAFKDAKNYCMYVVDNSTQDQCNWICEHIDFILKGYNG